MNPQYRKENRPADLTQVRHWLNGETRISREVLGAGAVLLLLLLGVALD